MTHWFDRLSRRGQGSDNGVTRREALAHAGAAGLSLSVLGAAAAHAQPAPAQFRARHVFRAADCQGCIQKARGTNQAIRKLIGKEYRSNARLYLMDPSTVVMFFAEIVANEIGYRRRPLRLRRHPLQPRGDEAPATGATGPEQSGKRELSGWHPRVCGLRSVLLWRRCLLPAQGGRRLHLLRRLGRMRLRRLARRWRLASARLNAARS